MKLGLGLYRHQLNAEHYRFARQAGCTHLVIHLVDYFRGSSENRPGDQPSGGLGGWGRAGESELWTAEQLLGIRREVEREGLQIAAIENFDPAHWHDVLLDGPQKAHQLEGLCAMIRSAGEAGIPCIGYNFSLAGVAGRTRGPYARGGAEALGMEGPVDDPIPKGMVWNMVYDAAAAEGTLPAIGHDELWKRLKDFLEVCLPVAESAGVVLAAHPDDPPLPFIRGTPRLVYQPDLYQRLIDLAPSPANQLEYCVGSIAEMTQGDIYEATESYSHQKRIAYVHLRNVRGKVPTYRETFVDEGDVDIFRILEILRRNKFEGVIIPDHAPQMSCEAPWHAGMAFALGYLRAAMQSVEKNL